MNSLKKYKCRKEVNAILGNEAKSSGSAYH